MLRFFATAIITASFFAGSQPSMSLTADERALVAHVDAHNDEALALLERAVNINSGTQNFAGVREVGKLFDAELSRLGFKTTWVDGTRFNRAGHLVAERPGKGPRILLIGHLDTVFEPAEPYSVTRYRRPETPRFVRSSFVRSPTFVRESPLNIALSCARVRVLVAHDQRGAPASHALPSERRSGMPRR